jgi:hypothetical protein
MEVIVVLSLLYTLIWATLYHWCSATVLVVLAFAYARSYYDGAENTGKRQSDTLRRAFVSISQVVAQHLFGYRIEHSNELANPTAVIYAAQPHGLFALASYFNVMRADAPWSKVRAFTHRHVFALPLLRELALALGARDPTEHNIRQALANGESVYVVIDGARGMLCADRRRHDGLLRIAFDMKVSVCPVVHHGHDQVFQNRTPAWLAPVREFLMDLVGYPFPTLWTMHCAPLSTRVLAPLDPTQHDSLEHFVAEYYKRVERCQALDHLQQQPAKQMI